MDSASQLCQLMWTSGLDPVELLSLPAFWLLLFVFVSFSNDVEEYVEELSLMDWVSFAFAEDVVWELVPEVEVEEGMVISLVQVLTDAIDL